MKKGSNLPPPEGVSKPAPPPAPPRKRLPGRGGARTAGPGKKIGPPGKAPEERTIVKGPYRLPPDVVEILGRQRNATAYIVEAVRQRASIEVTDVLEVREVTLEVNMVECRCGTDYVIINDVGRCPNKCVKQHSLIKEPIEFTVSVETLCRGIK